MNEKFDYSDGIFVVVCGICCYKILAWSVGLAKDMIEDYRFRKDLYKKKPE